MRQPNRIMSRFLALMIINQILAIMLHIQSAITFETETDNIRTLLKTED